MQVESGGPKASAVPELFYDRKSHNFWYAENSGVFQSMSPAATSDKLETCGLSGERLPDGTTQISRHLVDVRDNHGVDAVLSLAGYKSGIYDVNGNHLLVDRGFSLIEPAAEDGEFNHVEAIFSGLLFNPDGKTEVERTDPYWHLLAHLKNSYLELKAEQRSGSLAVFFCGPADSGKTLLLELIVAMLGGRYGNAYLFISGQTSFNDELMSKECWVVDDGVPMTDYAARRRLSGVLKQSVAAGHVPCHGKGKAQLSLPLYRRMFVALNPEDMDTLPHLSESLDDKYMLLKVKPFEMPKGCLPLPQRHERPAFMAKLKAELPYFIRWLLAQDLSAYASRRFGVNAYKNPDLVAANVEASGLDTKYAVLCDVLFRSKNRSVDAIEMKTSDIWLEITNPINGSATISVFRNAVSLGMALGELAGSTSHRHLVSKRVRDGYAYWTVKQAVNPKGSLSEPLNSRVHFDETTENKGENRGQ